MEKANMHNPAKTDYPVHEIIQNRWSPRAFSNKPVSREILRSLFEAARWAPSSSNEQPWAFIVGTNDDSETHRKILSTMVEFNQAWAKHAPVLAIAVSEMEFAHNKTPNRNAFYDTGSAVAHLTAEATWRGLFVHQMAGFDPHKASEVFHIPKGWEAIAVFAVGHPGDPNGLPDKLRERELAPRSRKPISEFVMSGEWGHPAKFLSE
jgi:nitroreductase